jgi:hypothetical protein
MPETKSVFVPTGVIRNPIAGDWFVCPVHGMECMQGHWWIENEYEIYDEVKVRVDD